MTLKIISAEDILFEGEVTIVHLPGAMGNFTVLPRHAALVSNLVPGQVRYTAPDGTEHSVDVSGGIADVDNNTVAVCIY